jgi:tetratricopeptide (TPR) repeat protein
MQRKLNQVEEHTKLGDKYRSQRKLKLAISSYQNAVRLDPQYAPAYAGLGISYYHYYTNLKKTEETPILANVILRNAIYILAKALTLDGACVNAYYYRGLANQAKGEMVNAIYDYSSVLKLDPTYSAAYYHRGVIYENDNKIAKALSDYTHALNINPAYKSAVNKLQHLLKHHNKKSIFKVIKSLPEREAIPLLAQCLNGDTLIGKVFWKNKHVMLFKMKKPSIEEGILKKIDDHLALFAPEIREIREVKKASRIIAQGTRTKNRMCLFNKVPEEVGVLIAAYVANADILSSKKAYEIACAHFGLP